MDVAGGWKVERKRREKSERKERRTMGHDRSGVGGGVAWGNGQRAREAKVVLREQKGPSS